jgi:hypothetical protein
MAAKDDRIVETSQATPKTPANEGFIKEMGREIGKELLSETGTTIKWAACGALMCAAVLGGFGFWKFGLTGLAIGAAVGAIIGAVVGGWVYLSA